MLPSSPRRVQPFGRPGRAGRALGRRHATTGRRSHVAPKEREKDI